MAMLSLPVSVPVPTSVAAGAATYCGGAERKTLTLEASAMTATYQAQISCKQPDPTGAAPGAADTSWVNAGAALTAAGFVEITAPCFWIRWNCTAYTSGTPTSELVGVESTNRT